MCSAARIPYNHLCCGKALQETVLVGEMIGRVANKVVMPSVDEAFEHDLPEGTGHGNILITLWQTHLAGLQA